jgi:hypothetical protein
LYELLPLDDDPLPEYELLPLDDDPLRTALDEEELLPDEEPRSLITADCLLLVPRPVEVDEVERTELALPRRVEEEA